MTINRWIWLLLTIIAVRDTWHVEFTPNPLNTGVLIITECTDKGGKLTFRAVDFGQIDPGWDHVDMHRQTTPKGDRCEVEAFVMRNTEGAFGDAEKDYVGESEGATSTPGTSEEEFP